MKTTRIYIEGNLACHAVEEIADILVLPARSGRPAQSAVPAQCIAPACAAPTTSARPSTRASRLFACCGLAIVGAVIAFILSLGNANPAMPNDFAYAEVLVEPGDSLWSIAREHAVADLKLDDAIDLMRERNHLTSATLQPGMELLVPISLA